MIKKILKTTVITVVALAVGACGKEVKTDTQLMAEAEARAEAYNHRSKYLSFPLRCAQIAMYAFPKPSNQFIADMHLSYASERYDWSVDDLKEADSYIKDQFRRKIGRYPQGMPESDLLHMFYASDFSCNDHK